MHSGHGTKSPAGKTGLSCRARLARDCTPNDEQKPALADWPEAANRFAAVMLHLRSRYVSKAAILTDLALDVPVENRSPA